jgi:hypothetical protein
MESTNPFNPDKVVSPEQFLGREVQLEKMQQLIETKSNILLYGNRRYGKTALIKKCFSVQSNVLCIYIDVMEVTDAMHFARLLFNGVQHALPFHLRNTLEKMSRWFSKMSFKVGPNKAGDSLVFSPDMQDMGFEESLEVTFSGITRFITDNSEYTHCVIAIDEFQQVSQIKEEKVDAILRKISQVSEEVSFIFSGSKKNLLRAMMMSPDAPFYQMVTPIYIEGIEEERLHKYCNELLQAEIDEDAFQILYQWMRGTTKLILTVCRDLWWKQASTYSLIDIRETVEDMINLYGDTYNDLITGLTPLQRKALLIIQMAKCDGVFNSKLLNEFNITKQSLNQVLEKFIKNDVVSKHAQGEYVINDTLFALWIEMNLIEGDR